MEWLGTSAACVEILRMEKNYINYKNQSKDRLFRGYYQLFNNCTDDFIKSNHFNDNTDDYINSNFIMMILM